NFLGKFVAVIVAVAIGGTCAEHLAFVLFLVGIPAEVIFLFQKQPIFAAEEISGGKAGDTAADDGDIHFARGVGLWEGMAVANLMAGGEMLSLNEGRWRWAGRLGHECFVNGTSGSNGTGHNIFDEVTACMRHANESS